LFLSIPCGIAQLWCCFPTPTLLSLLDVLIVIWAKKCPSLSFLAEAHPRLLKDENKRYFLTEVHIRFFRRPHEKNYKFILYLRFSNLDKFINIQGDSEISLEKNVEYPWHTIILRSLYFRRLWIGKICPNLFTSLATIVISTSQ
jgi:hypothetical protein